VWLTFALLLLPPKTFRECVGRKISYEKSATAFSVKLGSRNTEVIQEFDAFTTNVAVDPTREVADVVLQHDVVEDPRYQGLKKEDRQKVGTNDVSKPSLRKDWNCPWIRRDGKGIKQVLKAAPPVGTPIRTSHHHFYSEPQSLLVPEMAPMAPEELERIIQERMGLVNKEQEQEELFEKQRRQQMQMEMEMVQQQQHLQEERFEQNKMEVEFSHQQQQQQQQQQHHQQQQQQQMDEVDEEDSCPPDLEAVEIQQRQEQVQVQQQVQFEQVVEHQEQQGTTTQQVSLNSLGLDPSSELVRNLAIAIKVGMENYQEAGSYEPSADELIDVLKNLENLAAFNPALYRAIVDQIKVCHSASEQGDDGNQLENPSEGVTEQTNGHGAEEEMQQGFSEVDREVQQEEEQVQQEVQMNGKSDHMETEQGPGVEKKTPEQLNQEAKEAKIKEQVDLEHAEQMKEMKERKRSVKEPPPPPKTITVMAGGRNKPSWPIAPGMANANVPRQIQLQSAEDEEELYKSRLEVAEAAGLKHVEIIRGDEDFYPHPMKDDGKNNLKKCSYTY
jgi:hypothetical protein